MFRPSIIFHTFGSIILAITIIFIIFNFVKIQLLDIYSILVVTLLFSIAITIHGISHLGLERRYNYNPLTFFYQSKPSLSNFKRRMMKNKCDMMKMHLKSSSKIHHKIIE
jgi:hypothetical protein